MFSLIFFGFLLFPTRRFLQLQFYVIELFTLQVDFSLACTEGHGWEVASPGFARNSRKKSVLGICCLNCGERMKLRKLDLQIKWMVLSFQFPLPTKCCTCLTTSQSRNTLAHDQSSPPRAIVEKSPRVRTAGHYIVQIEDAGHLQR